MCVWEDIRAVGKVEGRESRALEEEGVERPESSGEGVG